MTRTEPLSGSGHVIAADRRRACIAVLVCLVLVVTGAEMMSHHLAEGPLADRSRRLQRENVYCEQRLSGGGIVGQRMLRSVSSSGSGLGGVRELMGVIKAILAGILVVVALLVLLLIVIAVYLRIRGASLGAVMRFIPNLAGLVRALYRDERVPAQAKVVLTALMAYLATPFDIIPDFIPLLGYLDDVIVAAVALDGLFNQIGGDIIREHWQGDPDTLAIVQRTAHQLSFFVPAALKRRLFAGPRPGDEDDD